MSTPELSFFESPHPIPNSSDRKRQKQCTPDFKEPPPGDLRWEYVKQWLTAKDLAENTDRAYTKELKRFWNWTDKTWNQVTTWDITCYKNHLETAVIQDPETDIPKRQLSSTNQSMK